MLAWRRIIAKIALILCFAVVLARAVDLQILHADHLSSLARSEYQGSIEILPERGDIYDRGGSKLAASIKVYSVYARPKEIPENQKHD